MQAWTRWEEDTAFKENRLTSHNSSRSISCPQWHILGKCALKSWVRGFGSTKSCKIKRSTKVSGQDCTGHLSTCSLPSLLKERGWSWGGDKSRIHRISGKSCHVSWASARMLWLPLTSCGITYGWQKLLRLCLAHGLRVLFSTLVL